MFDKYLYALGRGVRGIKDALAEQQGSAVPDPAQAKDITPPKSPPPPKPGLASPGGDDVALAPVLPIRLGPEFPGPRPLIMGIVNVTPDSFSDGGQYFDPHAAMDHGGRLFADGADIVDIGGESTRPGAEPVTVEDEIARVIPVIKALAANRQGPVSVDTMKAKVAAQAVEAGAGIINDVWGFQFDPEIARVASANAVHCVLMHNRTADDPDIDIFEDVRTFLSRSIDIALAAGVNQDRIILDPGIGFGKVNRQSLEMVARLGELKAIFKLPILLGLSRKRLIGEATGRASGAMRDPGTIAGNMYGMQLGADIIRVHNAAMHRDALQVWTAIRGQSGHK